MTNIFDSEEVAVSPIAVQSGKIENLSDKPNSPSVFGGNGMSATELKRAFDVIGVYATTKLSKLIEALKSVEAGSSIGIEGWDGTPTTVKDMLDKLVSSRGASIIGTGKSIDEKEQNLQEVIDDLYRLIASYKLDDIYDIKMTLGYSKESGACENYQELEKLAQSLKETVLLLKSILSIGDSEESKRLNAIESEINNIDGKIGKERGIASLDENGMIAQTVNAEKIVSGKLPLSVIPDAAFERTKIVSSEKDMYALTLSDVQNGDLVVLQESGKTDRWFKVVDDKKLDESVGYMEIIGGTTAIAQMAKEYDSDYSGGNSIAEKFLSIEGVGRTTENVKKNADDITQIKNTVSAIKGNGYTSGSVKENKDEIASLKSEMTSAKSDIETLKNKKAEKADMRLLNCAHSKSGTVHTFVIDCGELNSSVTEYVVKAKMTSDISEGDTFSISDGKTTYDGIMPLTYDGEAFEIEFLSGVYPVVTFTLDLGGSERHAFFKGGGAAYKGGYASGTLTENDLYLPTSGVLRNYIKIPANLSFEPRLIYLHGINANCTIFDINANSYTFKLEDESAVWERDKAINASSKSTYLSLKSAPFEWWTVSNSSYWAQHDKGPLSGIWEAFE